MIVIWFSISLYCDDFLWFVCCKILEFARGKKRIVVMGSIR